ncbi:sigma-70 family RNA polymerase sigma factor [Prauserella sp. ASG 168]|uniref:Sigma-70 family RNA polymerase sigma factor n=1 Tax=Prauserella cavernicola TaxID=2800127 RepID=A0A934QSG9_9PSEU|nr:sigma-70 family RNA polymerase sigma factor [Prauserella cavernicola]
MPLGDLPRTGGQLSKEAVDLLVSAARGGDPRAVDALLSFIKPIVARFCRARMGGRDVSYLSADDVAQEVCIAVVKLLPAYEARGGSFLQLVRAIAANKVADAFRLVARDRARPVPELPENGSVHTNEPEAHVLNIDLGGRLCSLLAELSPLQQEILALRVVVGLTAAETAEALGTSAGNVRVSQHRALEKLRQLIAAGGF